MRIGIDVGGTFTDLVAIEPKNGEIVSVKVPSTPRAPEEGVLAALDDLFARFSTPPVIEYLAHSTTIATNALLGQMHLELPRVAFVTTEGFRDVVEIGRQNRSEVYNLFVTRPKPLAAREDRIVVRERMAYDGTVLVPLDDAEIARVVDALRARSVGAVAIGFLHAYANDTHECRVENAIARAFPSLPITRSSAIDPEYREYERFSTAIVNAALMPIVQRYLDRLRTLLQARGIAAPLYVMQSNGGMAEARYVASRPATIIESGPASGVIAAAQTGALRGASRLLSFDMGGTTAKAGTVIDGVAHVVGEFEAAGATHSGRAIKGSGYPVRFPFVDLAEVSAGGGTIAWVDEVGNLRVGPLSAGADPGPACYGVSDRATVTDANVVLGRLNQTHLVGGNFAIDASRSRAAVGALAERIGLSLEATAAGIVRLVDSQMAKVLRIVTVERGLDPREFSMIAFGGNGPLHACALAEELGVKRIIVPAHPGVFSAYGLLVADLQVSDVAPFLRTTGEVACEELEALFTRLEADGRERLRAQGVCDDAMVLRRGYDARYRGQSFELDVAYAPNAAVVKEAFHAKHAARYGYRADDEAVEIVNLRLSAIGTLPRVVARSQASSALAVPHASNVPIAMRPLWLDDAFVETPVFERQRVHVGVPIHGPALIEQYDSCTYVASGWHVVRDGEELIVEHSR